VRKQNNVHDFQFKINFLSDATSLRSHMFVNTQLIVKVVGISQRAAGIQTRILKYGLSTLVLWWRASSYRFIFLISSQTSCNSGLNPKKDFHFMCLELSKCCTNRAIQSPPIVPCLRTHTKSAPLQPGTSPCIVILVLVSIYYKKRPGAPSTYSIAITRTTKIT
jgi:hypothetical protein